MGSPSVSSYRSDGSSAGRTFPRSKRLLNSAEFNRVFSSPEFSVSSRCLLLLCKRNDQTESRIGFVVGKKSLKRAVDRNAVKRRLREAFRLGDGTLITLDIVVVVRRNASREWVAGSAEDFERLMQRLHRKCSRLSAG